MIRFFLFCILSLFFIGCGLVKQYGEPSYYRALKKDNRDYLHLNSCGPEALQKALAKLETETNTEILSQSIQKIFKCNNLVRDFLSVFINDARGITFPEEIIHILELHGFKVVKVDKLEFLNVLTDVAIVLVKKENALEYHWMCFPIDKNISTFFGNETIIKEIYLITKNN